MDKRIILGNDIFDEFIRDNGYYVDKTELIYELAAQSGNKVTLFTRPRRFGKTLTMSMMESFFDVRRDSREIFRDLDICKNHPAFCEKWMNKVPVLSISLKDVEGLTFEEAYAMLKGEIAKLCIKLAFLETDEKVAAADSAVFHRLMYKTASKEEDKNALQTIMRMMKTVYGNPVILLIDEYDVPLAKAYSNGFYREMLDVIRGLLSTSLKTNEYLLFAVVTGCLRIPKESIFTGVNNFTSYSALDEDYSACFGFTQKETETLLEYYGREDCVETAKAWYDGYLFGNSEIYCPWDVMNYVSSLRKRPDAKPKAYWENTSGNDAIQAFFDMENVDIAPKFEALLNGQTITESVTNALTYEEAYASEDNLWSLLLMTGYVTRASREDADPSAAEEEGTQRVELRVPNREIAMIFRKAVVDHFNRTADQDKIRELMNALWKEEEEKASEILSDLLWNTISYMDYHEDYYHAFLAGIFVGRGGYAVQSNKERGLGRPDVDLRDIKNRRAMILEMKVSESKNRMEYWCDEAIRQIRDHEYAKNLDGYRKVVCFGISFFKKTAKVKVMR